MTQPELTEEEWKLIDNALYYYGMKRHAYANYVATEGSRTSSGTSFDSKEVKLALAEAKAIDDLGSKLFIKEN